MTYVTLFHAVCHRGFTADCPAIRQGMSMTTISFFPYRFNFTWPVPRAVWKYWRLPYEMSILESGLRRNHIARMMCALVVLTYLSMLVSKKLRFDIVSTLQILAGITIKTVMRLAEGLLDSEVKKSCLFPCSYFELVFLYPVLRACCIFGGFSNSFLIFLMGLISH